MNSLQTAKNLIESLPKTAKVIELAGPTPDGLQFLIKNSIHIAAKPLVTNKENPVPFYGLPPYPKYFPVDEVANVYALPYTNVDMFICSCLTWYNDRRYTRKQLPKRVLAGLHYMVKYLNSRANPRIALFKETAKALKPGGLLLVEGVFDEGIKRDYAIAKKCGFTLICKTDDDAALFQR